MKKSRASFTLIELLIVIVIIGILATIAVPKYQGMVITAKMKELFETVSAIEKAQQLYYTETGHYAGLIPVTSTQEGIDAFREILGIDVPGLSSVFTYRAAGPGQEYQLDIYVRGFPTVPKFVRIIMGYLDGEYKRYWMIDNTHPWGPYLKALKEPDYYGSFGI